MVELKKTTELQSKEILDLKLRHKDEKLSLEKEKNQLTLENKELEFKLRQQKLSAESEKLELMSRITKIEADKISIEKSLKAHEKDTVQEKNFFVLQSQSKITDLERKIELLKEEHRKELAQIRQDTDKSVLELKDLYENEIDMLNAKFNDVTAKNRQLLQEVEGYKQKNNGFLEKQVEELLNQLDYYKKIVNRRYKISFDDRESFHSICSEKTEMKGISARGHTRTEESGDLKALLAQNQKLLALNSELKAEINKIQFKFDKSKEKYLSNENKLRDEIKYLIGKLLKAKSKLTAEGELTESMRRESMLNTLRTRGLNQTQTYSRSTSKRGPN